jgi:RimJ/RimL family protein N-acetyltransferase
MLVPTPIRLETPRLILRRFEDRDIEALYRYRNDPEVARYQGWDVPYSYDDAEAMVKEMKVVPFGHPGRWVQLAIELKSTETKPDGFKYAGLKSEVGKNGGTMIGDAGFVVLENEPQQAEIGFTLDRAYQGQGYGSEAIRRLLDALFAPPLQLHRVRANIDPLNLASARLLERLGFRHEGRLIESLSFKGRWADEDWYAILRREWVKPSK